MPHRLGDIVDDYCSRCRMLTNNSVEAMVGEEVVKVRCRTCNFSHEFKNAQVPDKAKPRKTSKRAAFEAVLSSVIAGKSVAEEWPADSTDQTQLPRIAKKSRKEAAHHGLYTLSAARRKKLK